MMVLIELLSTFEIAPFLRLLPAMQLLASGEKVTEAALAGYSSTSSFVSMFRRQLGATQLATSADA